MGIEQSSYQNAAPVRKQGAVPRVKQEAAVVAAVAATSVSGDSGRSSPHPSHCSSDADVPYISYTVNKPIGDSPKHQGRLPGHHSRETVAQYAQKSLKGRNIVVVSQKSASFPGDEDAELQAIQRVPLFLPIIRSSLSTTHPREADIVDRLDTLALQRIVSHLQEYLHHNAESTAGEQNRLGQQIKEVDQRLAAIMTVLTERQKLYARYAEKLSRVHQISHSLSRCQLALAASLDSIATLNNQLPPEERLEPLVWSTG